MWSPSYKRFVKGSGLKNVRKGFGVLPSWPTFLPVGGIPIDHCLVRGLSVESVELGQTVGSDHYPLFVSLSL